MGLFAASLIIGGALGLFAGGLSAFSGSQRAQQEQSEIRSQQEAERRMREAQIREQRAAAERDIALARSHFKIEQQDALKKAGDIWKQAERIDDRSDIEETLTGRAFNLAVKRDTHADNAALHAEQRGKQNFSQKQGQMKAALGLSGTRAGTNSAEALLEQNAQNFEQDLSLMQNQRKTEREISLMGAWSSLRKGMLGIDESREAANTAYRDSKQLTADYSEGGRAVNLFNQKIDKRRADLQGNIDLQNLGGHFKQDAWNRAHKRAEYTFLDGLTDFAGGFNSGFNTGTSITNFAQNWGNFGAKGAASPSTAHYGAWAKREMYTPFGNAGVRYGDGFNTFDARKIRNPMGLPF